MPQDDPTTVLDPSASNTIVTGEPRRTRVDPTSRRGGAGIEVAVASDQGRVRSNNEDYALSARVESGGRTYLLLLVADGVGGGPRGERASELAAETVLRALEIGEWSDPGSALAEAIRRANGVVFRAAEAEGDGPRMATTVVAAIVDEREGTATIANVGDSRAYLLSADGIARITQDHSLVAARIAAGQLTEAEAAVDSARNILLRGVGTEPDVTVDVFGPRALGHEERLLLCSDGLHSMIGDDEIDRLARTTPTARLARTLVAAANEAGGKDNVTVVAAGAAPRRHRAIPVALDPGRVGSTFPGLACRIRSAAGTLAGDTGSSRPPRRALIAVGVAIALILIASLAAFTGGTGDASSSPTPGRSPGSRAPASPLGGPSDATPTPSPSPARTPKAASASGTPGPASPTPKPSRRATTAPVASATATPSPSPSPTPMPTATPTSSPAPTVRPPRASPSATATPTPTPSPTVATPPGPGGDGPPGPPELPTPTPTPTS